MNRTFKMCLTTYWQIVLFIYFFQVTPWVVRIHPMLLWVVRLHINGVLGSNDTSICCTGQCNYISMVYWVVRLHLYGVLDSKATFLSCFGPCDLNFKTLLSVVGEGPKIYLRHGALQKTEMKACICPSGKLLCL